MESLLFFQLHQHRVRSGIERPERVLVSFLVRECQSWDSDFNKAGEHETNTHTVKAPSLTASCCCFFSWSTCSLPLIHNICIVRSNPCFVPFCSHPRSTNEIKNLQYLPRASEPREMLFEDRTRAHADHIGQGFERQTTAAVGVLKAVRCGEE